MNKHPLYPDVLSTTESVCSAINTDRVRIVEVDFDPTSYELGHIESAILWDWRKQLRDPATSQILSKEQMESLLGQSGISNEDTVYLYGDENNWFACWAFWMMRLYGHENVFLIDGGARKWYSEGRQVTQAVPVIAPTNYVVQDSHMEIKASAEDIFQSFFEPDSHKLVDVRSSYEYQGRSLGPIGVEANCSIAGHIPTAINIPWNLNCNADGTFKGVEELQALYASFGITPDKSVITYCAIGERASLSWFVLKHLLKHPHVMAYDRSMAEWSRLANAPICKGEAA